VAGGYPAGCWKAFAKVAFGKEKTLQSAQIVENSG